MALFSNFWWDPKSGAGLYIPVRSAGLWQVCGLGNVTIGRSPGTLTQELQYVWEEFKDRDSWIFGDGCSNMYGEEVVKFYSNIPVGPNGDDYWVWAQAAGGLAAAFCVLCLIMIPLMASHNPYNGSGGCAHFTAFLQTGTGIAAIAIFVSIVARVASKKIWSDFDPNEAMGSLNGTADIASLAGGDLSSISGISEQIAGEALNQGWATTGNYWGWSFWAFVVATGLAIIGWPLLCLALCCCSGRRSHYRDSPYY